MNRIALGVVILGAGASSRMGRPKLLLPWGDTSIVGHLIRQWHLLGAEQIAIVCRAGDKPLTDELNRLDFPPTARIVVGENLPIHNRDTSNSRWKINSFGKWV